MFPFSDDPRSMINLVSGIHAGAVIKQCITQKVPDSLYFTEMMFTDHILLEMAGMNFFYYFMFNLTVLFA